MNQKSYYSFSGTVFLIIAVVHLLRAVNGWTVTVGDTAMPMWASYVTIVVAGVLAYHGLRKR